MNIYKCKKKVNSCPAFNTHINCFISNVLPFAILSSLALIQLIAWRWLYENIFFFFINFFIFGYRATLKHMAKPFHRSRTLHLLYKGQLSKSRTWHTHPPSTRSSTHNHQTNTKLKPKTTPPERCNSRRHTSTRTPGCRPEPIFPRNQILAGTLNGWGGPVPAARPFPKQNKNTNKKHHNSHQQTPL